MKGTGSWCIELVVNKCHDIWKEMLQRDDFATLARRRMTDPGHFSFNAIMTSSMNSCSSCADTFSRLLPMYKGSSRSSLLPVPRSNIRGSVASGLMPAQPMYNASLPTGIPMPLIPRSPSPNIREPSVTTVISTFCGQLRRIEAICPLSE